MKNQISAELVNGTKSVIMQVVIENCRNIDSASISIEPNKLNIKFAPNGTGKSSLSKALCWSANSSSSVDNELVPFKVLKDNSVDKHPVSVTGLEGIDSCLVFDEQYVESVVFQESQVYKNGYEVFVRTQELLETEKNLKQQLQSLVSLSEDKSIDSLRSNLVYFFDNLCGSGGLDVHSQVKGTAPVVKALKDGNTWEHDNPLLDPFKPLLKPGPFKEWAAWHKKGAPFVEAMEGACPYCGRELGDASDSVLAVDGSFPSAKAGNIEKTLAAVNAARPYLNKVNAAKLSEIIASAAPLSEQSRGYISKIALDARIIINALDKLRTVASFFDLEKVDDLEARLLDCQINLGLVNSFHSEKTRKIANRINSAIEESKSNLGKLKGLVIVQKQHLARALNDRCEEINSFLMNAGYPYSVEMSIDDDGDACSVNLVHQSQYHINNARAALSYGERNAFALVFFVYECLRKKCDLIILDDPITSFDGSKRYALLSMLFLGGRPGGASLKNKTVLLLTHDYGILFDIEHTHKSMFQPTASSSVLSNINGKMSETIVGPSDMVLAYDLYTKLSSESDSELVRLIYARKLLEIKGSKGNAYDVVSSLFHHRQEPTSREDVVLTDENIASGLEELEKTIGMSVDYNTLLSSLDDPGKMLLEFDGASCNYEKLQIARIALHGTVEEPILKERMDDSVHVGNGYLYQLNPRKFELVPKYIVDLCRERLEMRAAEDEEN